MRAGRLDHRITVQRATHTVNDFGTPVLTWTDLATLRAQVVEGSTEEFFRDFGASEETALVFRTRFLGGITTADRVLHGGAPFDIKGTKEIGRRAGLEIRCARAA